MGNPKGNRAKRKLKQSQRQRVRIAEKDVTLDVPNSSLRRSKIGGHGDGLLLVKHPKRED